MERYEKRADADFVIKETLIKSLTPCTSVRRILTIV